MKLFNLSRMKAKIRTVLISELLYVYADDAVHLTSLTEEDLQRLMDRFAHACREFGLTIITKMTNVMDHYANENVRTSPTKNNEKLQN